MVRKKRKALTREDVLKAIEKNGGTAKGLDLSGKVFEDGVDLSGLDLKGIILRDAYLIAADLEGATMEDAQLQKVFLTVSNLQRANLQFAKLQGANLLGTTLQEAALFRAEFSPDTELENADWGNYILGEEENGSFGLALDTYRRLKQWHTQAGMYDTAAKFYYREKEANRKTLKWRSKSTFWHRLALEFFRVLFGYGEEWKRILIWVAVVIFGLAGAYYSLGSFSSSSFSDTLYYSATSFTALGYGQWAPQPIGWARAMGAAEAFIGVFMMALLLVTFVRKWTR